MSKRTATQVQTTTNDGQPFSKATRSGSKRELVEDEMGEFEDAWEDEIEEEEIVGEGEGSDGIFISPLW
jgi:ribosome assembly protein RRB1